MKKITFIVSLLIISQSVLFSQSGWFRQHSGTTKYMNSCFFINDNTGYIVCNNGLIIKTTNGGSLWYTVYYDQIYHILSVYFINNTTGWAGATKSTTSIDSNVVLKTTNAGVSWNNYFIDTLEVSLEEISFLNESTGYLGYGYGLRRTTNGGINWAIINDTIMSGFAFHLVNSLTGWTGVYYGDMFKTTNGGYTWVRQYGIFAPHNSVSDIYFINENTGFVITALFTYGNLWYTTNSGLNWNYYNLFPFRVWSINFLNESTGYMLAEDYPNSYLAKTTNSGLNWSMHLINSTQYFSKLFFISENTGWIVGDSGTILKTTNGGNTIGIQQISTEIPKSFSLHQNYPNPFNPATKIRFEIPYTGDAYMRPIKITVFDILGKEVTVLVNEELKPGVYEVDFDGSNLPSGIYYYRLSAGSFTQTKKMVLIK